MINLSFCFQQAVDRNILAENVCAFELDIMHGQFNFPGNYFVRMTLCCTDPNTDLSGITMQKKGGATYEPTRMAKTDAIYQTELKRSYKFKDFKFVFFIPKGKSQTLILLVQKYETNT